MVLNEIFFLPKGRKAKEKLSVGYADAFAAFPLGEKKYELALLSIFTFPSFGVRSWKGGWAYLPDMILSPNLVSLYIERRWGGGWHHLQALPEDFTFSRWKTPSGGYHFVFLHKALDPANWQDRIVEGKPIFLLAEQEASFESLARQVLQMGGIPFYDEWIPDLKVLVDIVSVDSSGGVWWGLSQELYRVVLYKETLKVVQDMVASGVLKPPRRREEAALKAA